MLCCCLIFPQLASILTLFSLYVLLISPAAKIAACRSGIGVLLIRLTHYFSSLRTPKKKPVYCPQYWDRDCFCSKPNDDVDFHTKHHISPANFRTGLLDSNQSKNLISRIRIRLGFQCSSRAVSSLRSNVVFQSATVYSSLDGDMPKIEN